MIIVGSSIAVRKDAQQILSVISGICHKYNFMTDEWNGYNMLHKAASRVGGLDLGFVPSRGGMKTQEIIKGCSNGDVELLYLLAADEVKLPKDNKAFVVYQGHHGDAGAHAADVILPGTDYTQKDATYVNTEGRVQFAYAATSPMGEAREDWYILAQLSEAVRKSRSYESLRQVRESMARAVPHLKDEGIAPAPLHNFGKSGEADQSNFKSDVVNFYMTDPISRASKTMAKCAEEILNQTKQEVA